jgi:hypothetical protein
MMNSFLVYKDHNIKNTTFLFKPAIHNQSNIFSHKSQVVEKAPKKPRKAKTKKIEEFVEVIPIQFHCPSPRDKNHHLHEMINKIELSKIVGWNTTITKEKLVKGFKIECFINNQTDVIDAIIDRSIIFSINKSEVFILLFNQVFIYLFIINKNQINIMQEKPIEIKVSTNENVFKPGEIEVLRAASQTENLKLKKKVKQPTDVIEISDNDDTIIAGK